MSKKLTFLIFEILVVLKINSEPRVVILSELTTCDGISHVSTGEGVKKI